MKTAEDSSKRARRLYTWLLRGLIGLAGLGLAAAIGVGLYGRHVALTTLREAVAEADRLEPGWKIDQLEAKREVLKDASNSALRVTNVIDKLPEGWKGGGSALPKAGDVPNWEKLQGLALWNAIPTRSPNVLLTKEQAEAVRAETKRLGEPLALARTLSQLPKGRYPIDWRPDLLEMPLPHLLNARHVASLLNFDATSRAQEGDLDGALDSCRAMLNVARSFGDEPLSFSQLVRMSIVAETTEALERTLARGEPSDSALAATEQSVLAEFEEPVLLYTLRGERANAFRHVERIGRVKALPPGNAGALPESRVGYFAWLTLSYNQGLCLHGLNQAVEIVKKPWSEQPALWEAWRGDVFSKEKSPVFWLNDHLAEILMPVADRLARTQARSRALSGATVVLIAAERFRRLRHQWPESAEQIEEALSVKLPRDPFASSPFHVKRLGDGLAVYSVGPDEFDDEGTLNNREFERPQVDLGYRLWNVAQRRQAP